MADSLLGWCSAVFAVCGAVLVVAGLHHAGGALLVASVACVAALFGGGRWRP